MLKLATLVLLILPLLCAACDPVVKNVTSADGTTIYADATGDPGKQSLVFVHGFSFSGVVFDRLFTNKKLSKNFYLVRYDMRGHGRSGKPDSEEAYKSARYAEDFSAVSEAFGLEKPFYVGWSLGASIIADIIANIDPIPIAGAVALSGSPSVSEDILHNIASDLLQTLFPEFVENDNVTLGLQARVDVVETLFKNPSNIPFSLQSEYLGQTVVLTPAVSGRVASRPSDRTKLLAAGDAGTLPLMIIFGDAEKLFVPSAIIDIFKPHFKDLVLETVSGGHASFEDSSARVVTAISSFVSDVLKKQKKRALRFSL
ncbi:hypothetical protein HGRIS_011725 [Hohenbuehelia grisea]|uniref:AB hydrolase-1 domain-containing protein n=1 Tax=Hohenbuehelia grisea TaxID=104357 RepID=A0ABR3JVZ5_9AGAR